MDKNYYCIKGDTFYQKQARKVLCALIERLLEEPRKRIKNGGPIIIYSDLGGKVGVNPKYLAEPLNVIEYTRRQLNLIFNSKDEVPMINSIVVSDDTDYPSNGINVFLEFEKKPAEEERKKILDQKMKEVFEYPKEKWYEVLEELGLEL